LDFSIAGYLPHERAIQKLWAGVDLRTVQQWLGHSGMESTMRYLKPSRNRQTQQKVNEIFA
jgi:integrase/recombinase XerD